MIPLELFLQQTFRFLHSPREGLKGKELENARVFRSAPLRGASRTLHGRTLRSPHSVGFANPIEERGLSVVCGRLTVSLRYTVRRSIDSVNWSYFRPVTRLTVRAVG